MKWCTETFIIESKKIHGSKFDYSLVNYINSKTKIKLKCNKCGHVFNVLRHNHLNGVGCKKCQYKKLTQNQPMKNEDFIKRSKEIYSDDFKILTKYKNFHSKIKLKCNKCGHVFERRAGSHLEKYYGCKKCQYKKLPQNQPDKLFEINV